MGPSYRGYNPSLPARLFYKSCLYLLPVAVGVLTIVRGLYPEQNLSQITSESIPSNTDPTLLPPEILPAFLPPIDTTTDLESSFFLPESIQSIVQETRVQVGQQIHSATASIDLFALSDNEKLQLTKSNLGTEYEAVFTGYIPNLDIQAYLDSFYSDDPESVFPDLRDPEIKQSLEHIIVIDDIRSTFGVPIVLYGNVPAFNMLRQMTPEAKALMRINLGYDENRNGGFGLLLERDPDQQCQPFADVMNVHVVLEGGRIAIIRYNGLEPSSTEYFVLIYNPDGTITVDGPYDN